MPAPSFLWKPVIIAAFPKGLMVGGGAGATWWKLTLWEEVWQEDGWWGNSYTEVLLEDWKLWEVP